MALFFNFPKQNYLYHYQDTGLEFRLLENHIRVLLHTTSFFHFKRRAKKKGNNAKYLSYQPFKHATCAAPMFLATIVKYCAKIDFSVEKQRNTQDTKCSPCFKTSKQFSALPRQNRVGKLR